jgi:phytanoyl-CoA hydroxylase
MLHAQKSFKVAPTNYSFQEHGFIILQSIFDEQTLSSIRDLTERIIIYGEKELEDPFRDYSIKHRVDQGVLYDLFQRHPEFQDLAKNPQILNALEAVLGEDIFLYENSLVYKPKNKNNEVPWHQDFMSRPTEPRKFIAWIALDKVTKENGAMKLIPGSHKLGFTSWYQVAGETHHTRANVDNFDLSQAIYAELNAGDVLIFNQLVLHSSDRVSVDAPRRAYRVAYQGFEQICVPRSVPIVLKGGSPESLAEKYPNPRDETIQPKPKNLIRRIFHKAAKVLQKI